MRADQRIERIEDAPEWLRRIMTRHGAVFYEPQPDGLPIVSVPKPGRGSLYDERKVTREMKDDAVKLVETGEWPLGRLEFPKARRRSRSPR